MKTTCLRRRCKRPVSGPGVVWCLTCSEAGHKRMMNVARSPWWTWLPYRGLDMQTYLAELGRFLVTEADPALACPGGRTRVELPPMRNPDSDG